MPLLFSTHKVIIKNHAIFLLNCIVFKQTSSVLLIFSVFPFGKLIAGSSTNMVPGRAHPVSVINNSTNHTCRYLMALFVILIKINLHMNLIFSVSGQGLFSFKELFIVIRKIVH